MSRVRVSCAVVACLAVACESNQNEGAGLFGRKSSRVTLEEQLGELAKLGISLNEGVTRGDLFDHSNRGELEKEPYRKLAEALGTEVQREPWTPMADRLWMCDVERIEGPGSYQSVIERLERMTAGVLRLTKIHDDVVQFEEGQEDEAWVAFTYAGRMVRWEMEVDDDWLDGSVISRYDSLLREAQSSVRLFAASYGQEVFLAALTPEQNRRFSVLTGIAMEPVR